MTTPPSRSTVRVMSNRLPTSTCFNAAFPRAASQPCAPSLVPFAPSLAAAEINGKQSGVRVGVAFEIDFETNGLSP